MRNSNNANIFSYNYMFFTFFLLVFILTGCNDSNPIDSGGAGTLLVFTRPYNSPIYHPSGKFIGFNHIPMMDQR